MTKHPDASEADITKFIADFHGSNLNRLNPQDIFGSLGLDGDDAFEFMTEYSDKFNVNLDDYRWFFHNGEEGFGPGALFFKPPHARVQTIPISVSLLTESAATGKWMLTYPPP